MSRARQIGIGVAGFLGVATVGGALWALRGGAEPPSVAEGPTAATPRIEARGSIADRLRAGDDEALAELTARLAPPDADPELTGGASARNPLSAAEADEFVGILDAMAAGFRELNGSARISTLNAVGQILDRFAVEGVPAGWSRVLDPSFEVIASGLTDREPSVRIAAADLVANLWVWSPGCTMTPAEENDLGAWKEGIHPLVVRSLGDREPGCRSAVVRCLGRLPIDDKAAPAIASIRDGDFHVRFQTLVSFGNRPGLLTAEEILPLLHDPIPDLANLAERVLKGHGLSQELVGLGRLISHARPDIRASAIPMLLKRDDIDPVVWLLRLTRDTDPSVRLQAVEALDGRITAEVTRRLQEMAADDESEDVRTAAGRLAPLAGDRTVALPPLPEMPGLHFRAN